MADPHKALHEMQQIMNEVLPLLSQLSGAPVNVWRDHFHENFEIVHRALLGSTGPSET